MSDDGLRDPLIHRPRRAALFAPGDKPRALEKAAGLGADVLILDLEDAVAPEAGTRARAALADARERWRDGGSECVVRINAPGTEAFEADLRAVAPGGWDAVLVAKVDSAPALVATARALDEHGHRGAVWAMIETPQGVLNLPQIAEAGREARLGALVAGSNDLALALRLPDRTAARAVLTSYMTQIVLAARACGAAALDSVYNAYTDTEGLVREAREARLMGFDGKTVIHPAQIDPVKTAFAPADAELDWARRVVAAFDDPAHAGKGAIALGGAMVERLHLDHARAILAKAG